ncbi:MAG: hypothetical protein K4H23_03115 [Mollicutes bacterium PWAP]|nr:hypothetical protein [Mollicutes bacterium PWAP]
MFEYDKDKKNFSAAHHPFTSPSDEFIDDFDVNKEKAKAKAYDLVLNGFEIGGGSVRIFDMEVQKRMFKAIGMNSEDIKNQFGFFIKAFQYGVPPHAGIAFGLDRIIMILSNSESIRETIAFPKNAKGKSLMEEAPAFASENVLEEYGISVKDNK